MRMTNRRVKYGHRLTVALLTIFMLPHLSFAWRDMKPKEVQTDRAPRRAGAEPAAAEKSSASSGETLIYWCPMRGLKGCGIKDYSGPGKCEVCKMLLVPKSAFLEEYKSELASARNDWPLTKVGREEIYYCRNRGRPDHQLKQYTAPGKCEICGQPLVHKARFEEVKSWTCVIESCLYWKKTFFSPGRCPGCGEPVESVGLMDHNPVQGGVLFIADNNYHRLEGTHPSPTEFRVYFYDDYKKPLDARNFSGRITTEDWNEDKKAYIEKSYPLVFEREGNHWLTARMWAPANYPVEIISRIWFAGNEQRFNFFFDGLTTGPKPGSELSWRPHRHSRTPLSIPEPAADVVREIFKRETVLQSQIEAKMWSDLHNPAFDSIDLANALRRKTDGLDPRERKNLGEIVVKIGFASDRLDRAADASDPERVRRYFQEFKQGLEQLQEIFPPAAK